MIVAFLQFSQTSKRFYDNFLAKLLCQFCYGKINMLHVDFTVEVNIYVNIRLKHILIICKLKIEFLR